MKSRHHHILRSAVFFVIILLFLGLSQTVFSQTTQTFTSDGTFTVPGGVTEITVECWGAGGGGATNNGGGGGGGSYARSVLTGVSGNYTVIVGTGGAPGNSGGASSFDGGTVNAPGGIGATGTAGANGGIGGTGDVTYNGGNGAAGSSGQGGNGGGGGGGAGSTGAGGNASGITGGTGTANNGGDGGEGAKTGANGLIYGGGGGGNKTNPGGSGANGYVTVTYTLGAGCNLDTTGLTNIQCDFNGTPSNPTDDTFTFDLNPTGTNLGATYNITGDVTDSGTYGSATNFGPYPISGGNLSITITDVSGNCSIGETVPAPATCSTDCNLNASGLTNIECDPNGTPTIPGDDTFTFDLNPTGTNLGTSYTVSGGASGSGTYGLPTNFGPYPISGGNLSITITDDLDGSCTIVEAVPAPAPCSTPVCNLTASGLTNTLCDPNGTPSNSADDIFYFDLNPAGTNLGASYNLSGGATGSGTYGSATTFGPYNISNGNLSITITDVSTNCSFGPFTVIAPASCSNGCNLTSAGLSSLFCDNNGTLSDDTDDTFTFKLKPVGTNLGTSYTVSEATLGAIGSGSYGSATTFGPFDIINGPIYITITDATDGSCTIDNFEIIPPSTCSLNHTFTSCASCHITHNAPEMSLTQGFGGNALLCQSCHADGMLATNKPLVNGEKAVPGVSGNSHAWDVLADDTKGYQTTAPATTTQMGMRLPEGKIICSTCHNQHNNGSAGSPYLRVDNTGDAMCKQCHITRDVQRFQDGGDKGSHPVGVAYSGTGSVKATPTGSVQTVGGNIECSSCHGTHDVANSGNLTNDGNLLRTTGGISNNGNSLCLDCHNYVGHSGFDCLDCHEVHNTVDDIIGSNLMMIKDQIDVDPTAGVTLRTVEFLAKSGANSFVDTSTPRKGICVVCHTNLSHDNYNDDVLVAHDDTFDKAGQTCTGCHLHNDATNAFTQPIGPQSCVSCHSSSVAPVSRSGAVQIVGAGGEMDNTLISRHSTSTVGNDVLTEECEACHYESAGDHPSSQMRLEDSQNLNTVWSGTDTDVYCIGCHDGSTLYPSLFPDLNTDPKYNKASYISTPHDIGDNSCMNCHERHGSQYAALTKAATNYENCFACHDGGVASTTISAANIAIPGTSGTGHAFSTGINPVSASSGLYQTNPPSDPAMVARLDSENIVCSTCHDPHANTNGKLLVSTNTGDAICKDCHSVRDVGRFIDDIVNNKGSHPVGLTYTAGGNYVDPAPTLSTINVGLVNGNIECSSCHSVHNATTTDGNLLRETMTSATCKECHNYLPHQGFDCLDCHEMHNVNNIMLIKDQIDIDLTAAVDLRTVVFNSQGITASPVQSSLHSFADGDEDNNGTYDGICEVCHTNNPKTYHYNNLAGDHTHNVGKDCTSCHPHRAAADNPVPFTSFPNGSCHSCHEDPTPGLQEYPLTGAHEKHAGLQYGYTCSTCHFGHGDGGANEGGAHGNNSTDVVFEPGSLAFPFGADASLTPTWDSGTKTCSNIYCHSDGRNAFRGIDDSVNPATSGNNTGIFWTASRNQGSQSGTFATTPAWDTGTINDCDSCHEGNGNMTAPYTIAITDNIVHDPPPTGKHESSSHYNNAKDAVGNGWPGTQCFWCHNTNQPNLVETGKNQGDVQQSGMLNGTYGTSFHVDGATYFLSESVVNGGSMINRPDGTTYSHGTTPDAQGVSHCGDGKQCW